MEEVKIIKENFNCVETTEIDYPQKPFIFVEKEEFIQKDDKNANLKNSTNIIFDNNYKTFINELFKTKGFIAQENWEKTINVNSKIIQSNSDYIICECLIDREKRIFEKRSFPKHLFEHIENIKKKPFVVLSIKTKIGSTRIDVIKGEHLVDKKAFELNEEWEKIEGKDFNQPLDKPIEL